MAFSQSDHHFMQRALTLAERSLFSTDPNPRVGCVFVKDDQILSEGWTQPAGDLHAEAYAIQHTQHNLAGAEAFVTLEPCTHFGRTPPCVDAIINAGIKRLVVAMEDPNPAVNGKGLDRLRRAGIEVETGLLAQQARQLNPGFIKRITTGLPHVILKMGMSMDAKTAMASGESQWITCAESRKQVQHLRARSAAVITGRQTVVSDDPSMNVRPQQLPEQDQGLLLKQPLRVVLDSRRTLTGNEKIFNLDDNFLWISGPGTVSESDKQSLMLPLNQDQQIDLHQVLIELGQRGCNEVLVEAGAELSGSFVAQDLVDEIQLFMAPVLLGHQARDLIRLDGLTRLSDKKQFRFHSATPCDTDVILKFERSDRCSQEL